MTDKLIPSPEELRKLLRYEPENGKLFWRPRPDNLFQSKAVSKAWNERYAGKEAFTSTDSSGYRKGNVLGRWCSAHRVIWAITTGGWPEDQIDHRNGDRTDNRIRNLREASHSENNQNQCRRKNNKSGFKGVCWHKHRNKWRARIDVSGTQIHLGYFNTSEEAHAVYVVASIKYHGDFARIQ